MLAIILISQGYCEREKMTLGEGDSDVERIKQEKICSVSQWHFSYPKLFGKPCMHKALHLGQRALFLHSLPLKKWQNSGSLSKLQWPPHFHYEQTSKVFISCNLGIATNYGLMKCFYCNQILFKGVLINLSGEGAHAFKDSMSLPPVSL